jgi:hypothetical protein
MYISLRLKENTLAPRVRLNCLFTAFLLPSKKKLWSLCNRFDRLHNAPRRR